MRVYPYNEEISHIVGYLGTEEEGLAGVEKKYNDILKKGQNIYLTIDSRVQFRVYQELIKEQKNPNFNLSNKGDLPN